MPAAASEWESATPIQDEWDAAAPVPPVATTAPAEPRTSAGEALMNGIARAGWALPGLLGLDHAKAQALASWVSDRMGGGNKTLAELEAGQRAYEHQAEAEHPLATGIGVGVGAIPASLLMPAAPAAQGAGLAARAGAAALAGGAQSAALEGGLTADLPPDERLARMAGAGVVGAALPVVGAAAGAGIGALRRKAGEVALEQGRKALTGNAGTMSVKKLLSPEAVDAAYEVGAIRTGASVKGIAERLGVAREAAGDEYGQIVRALEAAGVEGPKASRLALSLSDEARQMVQSANPVPDMFRGLAGEVAAEPAAMSTGRLPLSVAETIKRNLQNAARAEYVKEGPTSLAGEGKMALASRLRQAVEDAIDAQAAKAPAEAASFVPVKQRLGALIEADTAASTAAARAARKSNVGLTTAIAAGAGYTGGGPAAAAAAGTLAKVAQTRGAATLGSAARGLERSTVVAGVENLLKANPAALGPYAQQLSGMARRPGGLAAAHYVLSQTSPEYRLRLAELGVDGDEETQRQAQESAVGLPGASAAPPSEP